MQRREFLKTSASGIALLTVGGNVLFSACSKKEEEMIKTFCIDFNWDRVEGNKHGFARPGLWADADPQAHVDWYAALGCNAIQSFAVSCNGYAWYKNGIIPEQPGLKYDFLTEQVRLGHKKGMKVFGYVCAGANNKWEEDHPDLCYGMDGPQIPFTTQYLDYLCATIEDSIRKTDMDGMHLDWLWNPGGGAPPLPPLRWIPCEQEMYRELMDADFPGIENISKEIELDFRRKAIARAWNRIRAAVKDTKPTCLIWLSCNEGKSNELPENLINELDWILNEAGDMERTKVLMSKLTNPNTKLLTCLAKWNGQDAREVVPKAIELKLGLYGFTKPALGSLMPPIDYYLSQPIAGMTKGDELSIAVLARVFNNLPLDYVKK